MPATLTADFIGFSHILGDISLQDYSRKYNWKKRACCLTSGTANCCAIVTQCLALRSCPCGDVWPFIVVQWNVSVFRRLKLHRDGNLLHNFDSICSSVAGTVFNILWLVDHTIPFYGIHCLLQPWQTYSLDSLFYVHICTLIIQDVKPEAHNITQNVAWISEAPLHCN